ncbi:hypothetical protein, partial [Salmonella enterica]
VIEKTSFPIMVQFPGTGCYETIVPLQLIDYLIEYQYFIQFLANTLINTDETPSLKMKVFLSCKPIVTGKILEFSSNIKLTVRQFPHRSPDKLLEYLKAHKNFPDTIIEKKEQMGLLSFENIVRLCTIFDE